MLDTGRLGVDIQLRYHYQWNTEWRNYRYKQKHGICEQVHLSEVNITCVSDGNICTFYILH